jgi:hypothetical protein
MAKPKLRADTSGIVAFAERLGHVAGAMHARVDRLRGRAPARKRSGGARAAGAPSRSGGVVDAPGKKHRKAPQRRRGVKHSELAIAKMTTAKDRHPARRG